MHNKKGATFLYLLLISLAIVTQGCSLALDAVTQAIPQSNDVKLLSKKAALSKDKKLYVALQAPKLTAKDHYEWRNEYIVKALTSAGIKNYEILEPEANLPNNVADSYLLTINVPTWTVEKDTNGDDELWVPVTATIVDLPGKNELVKAGGDATDTASFGWSIGKMVSSLLREMLEEMYSPSEKGINH